MYLGGTSLVVQWLRLPSNAGGVGLIPGQWAKIPHVSQPKKKKPKQNIKQKQYCNKFNKDFKNGPHRKQQTYLDKSINFSKALKSKIYLSRINILLLK